MGIGLHSFNLTPVCFADFDSEQTLYRLMRNRLGTLRLQNPGSEGMADHSTGGLMLQDMIQVRGPRRAIWSLNW